jgi:peptidoglycan/LPS O-acetylase OafA/YrhL
MQPRKLDFIDSLRGLAALYVLCYHFAHLTTPPALAPRWLTPFTDFGGSGVTLFFVVSAFTLCLSMDARKQDEAIPLVGYFLRRFFRIAPLFYLWMILYCIRDKLVFDAIHPIGEISRSLFFVLNFFPGHEQGFVWASWTIGVEMLFYVLFPALFWLANNVGKAGVLFLAALLLRAGWHGAVSVLVSDPEIAKTYFNMSLLYHLPTFVFGIFVYRLYLLFDHERAAKIGIGYLLVGAALVTQVAIAYGLVDLGQIDGLTVEAIMYGTLLIGLSITAPRIIVNRVTRFYGKISYSVYLSHATTIFLMSPLFSIVYRHIPYVTVAYGISLALALVVITCLSSITYRFVEVPGNGVGRAIIRALRNTQVSVSSGLR